MIYILVGLAGMIGALLRYGLSLLLSLSGDALPFGTLLGNLIGSFVLGWFTTRIKKVNGLHPHLLTAIGTGLIGSFTTFSTFSVETVRFIHDAYLGLAFVYVLLSVVLGLVAAWAGYKIGDYLLKKRKRKETSTS